MDNRGGKVVHSHQKCAKIKYFQAAADQYKYAGIEFNYKIFRQIYYRINYAINGELS
jgi:hypothetical protein